MADKANTNVDELNKILTNTLDYKEVLEKLSQSVTQEATREKLKELAGVREKESQELMKAIKEEGGRIESNERMTDQESIYWVKRPLPEGNDLETVLSKLTKAETNAAEDYKTLLGDDNLVAEHEGMLEKHRQEAESNAEYFKTAQDSMKK